MGQWGAFVGTLVQRSTLRFCAFNSPNFKPIQCFSLLNKYLLSSKYVPGTGNADVSQTDEIAPT